MVENDDSEGASGKVNFRYSFERRLATVKMLQFIGRILMRVGYELGLFWGYLRFRSLVQNAGPAVECHYTVWLKHPQNLTIGNHVKIGKNVIIGCGSPVTIGDHVDIGHGALIETRGIDVFQGVLPYPRVSRSITIGRGVWIAANAIVLGGVTIGEYAVIGAGAIVSRDVPPYAFVNAPPYRIFVRKAHENPTFAGVRSA
jgi:acetyltransferase-like isoleucine patch superfamily enzyme